MISALRKKTWTELHCKFIYSVTEFGSFWMNKSKVGMYT